MHVATGGLAGVRRMWAPVLPGPSSSAYGLKSRTSALWSWRSTARTAVLFALRPLIAGTSHPELANLIAKRLGIPIARANVVQPPSGETKVTIVESVRDYDVYIVNTVSWERVRADLARRVHSGDAPDESRSAARSCPFACS